jgi:hypothetical protein
MSTRKQHLVIIPGSALGQPSAWRRGIPMAAAAVAVLLLGAILGATFLPQPGRGEVAKREIRAPEPALETWYVPAQYLNQATQIEEQPEAF